MWDAWSTCTSGGCKAPMSVQMHVESLFQACCASVVAAAVHYSHGDPSRSRQICRNLKGHLRQRLISRLSSATKAACWAPAAHYLPACHGGRCYLGISRCVIRQLADLIATCLLGLLLLCPLSGPQFATRFCSPSIISAISSRGRATCRRRHPCVRLSARGQVIQLRWAADVHPSCRGPSNR